MAHGIINHQTNNKTTPQTTTSYRHHTSRRREKNPILTLTTSDHARCVPLKEINEACPKVGVNTVTVYYRMGSHNRKIFPCTMDNTTPVVVAFKQTNIFPTNPYRDRYSSRLIYLATVDRRKWETHPGVNTNGQSVCPVSIIWPPAGQINGHPVIEMVDHLWGTDNCEEPPISTPHSHPITVIWITSVKNDPLACRKIQ
ncbi:hypothetical protein JTE90_028063 [Oedothorax gibbosus]|uniref:Uncharacterized protein n=1 Tax=Oedothorax gibbosus TaxID=931172 RepID=A0AAV6VAE4_9ARAC|nr:hypothetical protein JTE90_028063 [Oedothorax gibbosus]